MTLVSIPLMDRTGRRTLHLYGLGGMFIFSIFITISFLIKASIELRFLRYFNKNLTKVKYNVCKIVNSIEKWFLWFVFVFYKSLKIISKIFI